MPTNTPYVFHVETTWKRSFPRRFNVEYTWNVCRVSFSVSKRGHLLKPSDFVMLLNYLLKMFTFSASKIVFPCSLTSSFPSSTMSLLILRDLFDKQGLQISPQFLELRFSEFNFSKCRIFSNLIRKGDYETEAVLQRCSWKGVLKICSKCTEEHLIRNTISRNFIKIALRHGCSPVKLLYIFRTPFPKNTSGSLLLYERSNEISLSLVV